MKALVRAARQADREPLMSFIRGVWGGHDYIPRVWDRWLADPSARMFVVTADGVPVGMNRVRLLPDGSAWFEGARVHPDFRGRGLATMLGEAAMGYARERNARVFRLTSSSWNWAAHRQIARIGFRETSRISVYAVPEGAKARGRRAAAKVGRSGAGWAFDEISGSREYSLGGGVLWDAFTTLTIDKALVRRAVEKGQVFRLGKAIGVYRVGSETDEVWRQVCFLAGDPRDAADLALYLFGRGEPFKTDWSMAYVPQGSKVIPALRRAGLKREFALIHFERAPNG